jgi:hypothetical protein
VIKPNIKFREGIKYSLNNTDRKETNILGENGATVSVCPPYILCGLARDRTPVSAVYTSPRTKTGSTTINCLLVLLEEMTSVEYYNSKNVRGTLRFSEMIL